MTTLSSLIEQLSDERQRFAITAYPRCVMVAGPGSGKTYRLVLKTAYLLGQEVKSPYSIACITYLNDAVREIQDRLSLMGFDDDERLFVGTVHKFCIQAIIIPFKDTFLPDWPDEIQIAGDETQRELVAIILNENGIVLSADKNRRKRELSNYINKINDTRVEMLFSKTGMSNNSIIFEYSKSYVQLLRDNGLVDFLDIAIEAYRLVRTQGKVRSYITSRFPWLVIDEYQDLGRIFNALITTLIYETDLQFFIVGDANQSIMGFQGASPNYLVELQAEAEKDETAFELITIPITRRCLPHIVDVANQLLPENVQRISTIQPRNPLKRVEVMYCPDGFEAQVTETVKIINRLHEGENAFLGNIAVLFRNSYSIPQFGEALEDAQLSYSGNKDGRYARTPLTRWLEDIARWQVFNGETNRPKFQNIHRSYRRFVSESGVFSIKEKTELEIQTEFLNSLWNYRDPTQLVSTWLTSLVQNLQLDRIVEGIGRTSPYDSDAFWELSEKTINGDLVNMTIHDLALCGRSADSLFVSTLHSSKGLEFDAVIIPELEEGRLPDYRAKSPEQIAEERRLLFVGITRARNDVFLLHSGYYSTPWRVFRNGSSRFLREMGLL